MKHSDLAALVVRGVVLTSGAAQTLRLVAQSLDGRDVPLNRLEVIRTRIHGIADYLESDSAAQEPPK